MLAFTGLLLPGLLLLHTGHLPAPSPPRTPTQVVRKVVVRKVVHERTVVVREAAPAGAGAVSATAATAAAPKTAAERAIGEEDLHVEDGGAVLDQDRGEEDDLDAGGDHEDHARHCGASRTRRPPPLRRIRRALRLRPTRPPRPADSRRAVLRRGLARASREGRPQWPGRLP